MISSIGNPQIKRIRRLQKKKYRLREKQFFIEGLRVVLSALESGADIDALFYSSELLTSDLAEDIIRQQKSTGTLCLEVTSKVFKSISTRQHPIGLGAIVNNVWTDIESLTVGRTDIFVALFNVSDPGNLGAIFRSIDAAGASGLLLIGSSVDPYHPTAVKASMGTLFSVPHSQVVDLATLKNWINKNQLQTIATSAHAQLSYRDVDYRFPNVLLLGSEREGLPAETIEAADLRVSIPMHGVASSLNLATAATVLLYELSDSPGRPL